MAGSRTLKLSILADVDDLNRKLKQADNDVGGFTGQLDKFGKMAAAAFAAATAAAAAYATKLAVDGVKAAIEDDAAQKRLAQTLITATGATNNQIKATEDYITKMQLATGVADTDLRSALGRLSLSTNDLTKAQDLLSLALDISKARQIPLETVANALGKAYDGQTTALSRLGLGFSSAEIKGKSFADIQDQLTRSFGGAAASAAETYQGRIDRLKQAFAEFQEGIGYRLLPILTGLFDFLDKNLIPAFNWLKQNAIDPVSEAIMRNKDTFIGLYNFIKDSILPLFEFRLVATIKILATVASVVVDAIAVAIRALQPLFNAAIDGINLIIRGINLIKSGPDISYLTKLSTTSIYTGNPNLKAPSGGGTSSTYMPSISSIPSSVSSGVSSAGVSAATAVAAASTSLGATYSTPLQTAQGILNKQAAEIGTPQTNVTVNIGVAGDPEGTARTIIDVLNRSYGRGALGAENLLL